MASRPRFVYLLAVAGVLLLARLRYGFAGSLDGGTMFFNRMYVTRLP